MELKNFKLPEGVEVDFKPDAVKDEDKSFADYFNNLPLVEKNGIFSGKLKRSLEIGFDDETMEYTAEYTGYDDISEDDADSSVIGRIIERIRGFFK